MTADTRKSIEACAAHYGENADAMRDYPLQGEREALAMGNRGRSGLPRMGDWPMTSARPTSAMASTSSKLCSTR